jgi:glycosyltransferase involved in cell wall biosynthesis
MDFAVHFKRAGEYDTEIAAHDAQIYVCPGHRNLLRQLYALWRIQKLHGPYDVLHSHVDYYGGIVSLFGWLLRVPVRIVHSHADASGAEKRAGWSRRLYESSMRLFIQTFSTAGLGTSRTSAAVMFGQRWPSDSRWKVLSACVDLTAFSRRPDRQQIRRELGIPEGAVVCGHVGRFVEPKNHGFLVEIAGILASQESRSIFVLVGAGPTEQAVDRQIREYGLRDRFIVLGSRDDIPRLMLGAMDFFLFPSVSEGLGLALVEAQAAGLRCFVSTAVPPEAIVAPQLVHRLPLSDGPEAWAQAILREMEKPVPLRQEEALRLAEGSFDIRRNAAQLVEFYQAAVT